MGKASRSRSLRRLAAIWLLGAALALPQEPGRPEAKRNRLAGEKSPYLLQHARNPVDWYPWGEEAFARARAEDKPIFLSVGYSTCHWCHVMERESFEDPEIAAVLNRHFVPIKVDREERPDIDQVYMTYVQALTRSGGWPMSVWLTPDGKPIHGGSYFPPGRFRAILDRIAEVWATERAALLAESEDVLRQLREAVEREVEPVTAQAAWLARAEAALLAMYDAQHGGFGEAPKFPRTVNHNFLLRQHARNGGRPALEAVTATLRAMARGGIRDHLGGGFHRYSVDERWFVPHFEKMLYDQALIATSYLEAYTVTRDPLFAAVARETLEYVLASLTHPEGGFYSAEDADSVIDPAKPEEKGEGAFYIWSAAEIERALGRDRAAWFGFRYGVEPEGNVRHDPQGEFRGRNILFEAHTIEETTAKFRLEPAAFDQARRLLFEAQAKRSRPHLDDKILTGWNGLTVSALSLGSRVLEEPRFEAAARRAADFLLRRMYRSETGDLLRRYRDGEAAVPAFLADYAFLVQGLLDLYETSFETRYLDAAIRLTERQFEQFEDRPRGGFFTAAQGGSLVLRLKDDYDGAEPSGNSVAALNLLRLGEMTDSKDFREAAQRTLQAFGGMLGSQPASLPQMLVAAGFSLAKPKQIILVGGRASGLDAMLAEVNRRFLPVAVVIAVRDEAERAWFAERLPVVESMTAKDGRATAYVCENYACKLPVSDPQSFARLLDAR